MAKRVQLVLNKDVNKLGKLGDLVEVAPGYARNYLLPQKMAVQATPGLLKQAERRKEKERLRQEELKQVAQGLKATLEKVGGFTIAKQVGEGDSIFGTVTDREIATLIQGAIDQEVDRRGITLPDISKTGTYNAEVKLHPEVTATVRIQVIAE